MESLYAADEFDGEETRARQSEDSHFRRSEGRTNDNNLLAINHAHSKAAEDYHLQQLHEASTHNHHHHQHQYQSHDQSQQGPFNEVDWMDDDEEQDSSFAIKSNLQSVEPFLSPSPSSNRQYVSQQKGPVSPVVGSQIRNLTHAADDEDEADEEEEEDEEKEETEEYVRTDRSDLAVDTAEEVDEEEVEVVKKVPFDDGFDDGYDDEYCV
jgi:hypothetical protein